VFTIGFVDFAFVLSRLGLNGSITCVGVLYLRVFGVGLVSFCCLFACVFVCWGCVGWLSRLGWAVGCVLHSVYSCFCFIGCIWLIILVGWVGLFGGGLVLQLLRILLYLLLAGLV